MFQPWRLKVREADEALRAGRLEEAGRLLRDSQVRDFLPARQLMAKVAGQMVERAQRRVAGGQSAAGWRDLDMAQALGAEAESVAELRQAFVARRVAEAEGYLAAGEPSAALARLDDLARRGSATHAVCRLRDAAANVLAAQRLCRRGDFATAEQQLAAAAALAPTLPTLDGLAKACRVKAAEIRRLGEQLHQALAAGNWTEVLTDADAMLDLCPEHEPARDARRRAWAAVGMRLADSMRAGGTNARSVGAARAHDPAAHDEPAGRAGLNRLSVAGRPPRPIPANGRHSNHIVHMPPSVHSLSRFLLWVDGVGGYLVCPSDEVILGQPVAGSRVDVPILGDVSQRHARIRRDGESYLIDPLRPVRLDGRPLTAVTSLAEGSLIELGNNVRLRFRRPHPLSATARLEFVSHHRTQPSADAVLLLAESCVLGPAANSHVVCRDWSSEVVLFRQADALLCRKAGNFEVDGVAVADRAALGRRSQVVGDDFSLSIEDVA
ncbi:MAG: FHA domain-containing protein [Pirellulales bacterium]